MTPKPAHTPGEWKILQPSEEIDEINEFRIVAGDPMRLIATIATPQLPRQENDPMGMYRENLDEAAANANLIAAVPDLRALAEMVQEWMPHLYKAIKDQGALVPASITILERTARAAIAKAKGTPA